VTALTKEREMEDTTPPDVPGFKAALLFSDPTPNLSIINRITKPMIEMTQMFTDLSLPENMGDANDWIDIVVLISRKTVSVWKHLQAYHEHERKLVAKYLEPRSDVDYSQELFEEFDVFAVQIKSTLDHLVKALRPMIGRKWTMYTFSDKGESVLNSLKRNPGRKHEGRVSMMEHLLFRQQHKDWLGAIIDSRDRMNHCQAGGLKIENFAVYRNPDGSVALPRWSSQQSLADAMNGVWGLFFEYVEDFLACALYFRMRDEYTLVRQFQPFTATKASWSVVDRAVSDHMIATLGPTKL
jgi:hypothetical protein